MSEPIIPVITTSYSEFMEHMNAAGAELVLHNNFTETWACVYAGRDDVLAGTWDHQAKMGTLHLI